MKKIAVVMSLHELDLAQKVSDRILCISPQKTFQIGTPEEIFTDEVIRQLYELQIGSYHALTSALELKCPEGKPEIFVIGGSGQGIPIYHFMQRQQTAFITGILHQHDIDYPTAKALAAQVITAQDFEPISEADLQRAISAMHDCQQVICCANQFGVMNQKNQKLIQIAASEHKIIKNIRCSTCN